MSSGPRAKIMVAAFALATLVISASCIVGITSETYKPDHTPARTSDGELCEIEGKLGADEH